MVTFLKNLQAASEWMMDHGYKPGGSNGHATASAPAAPAPSNGGNGNGQSFIAESLVANVMDGKVYWAVQGGQFTQYGVRIWPEVLEAAGYDPDELDPTEKHDLDGITAYYTENDEGHKKVTSLVV
jgi:hypothetical protein